MEVVSEELHAHSLEQVLIGLPTWSSRQDRARDEKRSQFRLLTGQPGLSPAFTRRELDPDPDDPYEVCPPHVHLLGLLVYDPAKGDYLVLRGSALLESVTQALGDPADGHLQANKRRNGSGQCDAHPRAGAAEPQELSERELQVLHLVANGACNKQVARDLGISVNTAKIHLRNIFAKLRVSSRTEAVTQGLRRGLVNLA
jgi:DNA-binding CsgD family transcriptional regulator